MQDRPKLTILFLAADPSNAARLRLGQELRDIQDELDRAKERERFSLQSKLSARSGDINRALLDYSPHIIHFSGHGRQTGEICFEDAVGEVHPIEPDALATAFSLVTDTVQCVVLNACYTEPQAEAISEHIPFVIGMGSSIGDKAAIAFAVGFYKTLGAKYDGTTCDIEYAYKFGCAEIGLTQRSGAKEHLTPILYQKKKF